MIENCLEDGAQLVGTTFMANSQRTLFELG